MHARVVMGSGVVLAVLALTVGIGARPRWIHDSKMTDFERSARAIPLVEGRVVGSVSRFGVLWGAGNHCDAQVWVAVDSASTPAGFRAALPSTLGPGMPFPSTRGIDLWDATDPARPAYVGFDGSVTPLDANRQVPGTDRALESNELEAMGALARAHPVAASRHLYLLEADSQSYADSDLLDRRCH